MLSKIESMKVIINKKKVAVGKYITIFLVLLVLINVLLVNMPLLKSVFVAPLPNIRESPEFYQTQVPKMGVGVMDASKKLFDASGNAYDLDDALISMHNSGQYVPLYDSPYGNGMFLAALENRGIVNCYEHYKLPIAAQPKYFVNGSENPDYLGEAYLVNGDSAGISYFSPNKVTVNINTDEPTILVLNQNYHPGWKVQDSGNAEDYNGLISTSVSPSDKQVTFYYYSSSFKLGLTITILTLIIGFILFFRFDTISKRLNKKTAAQKR